MTTEETITAIIGDVCELPDYTSPDDQPDLLQCRVHELKSILQRHLTVARPEELSATERDAARWRKFNEVAKKHFSREFGYIKFFLPRSGGGFKGFEETIDEYLDPQTQSPPSFAIPDGWGEMTCLLNEAICEVLNFTDETPPLDKAKALKRLDDMQQALERSLTPPTSGREP